MSSIAKTFQEIKARGEGALIGYITAGDPTPDATPKIADALIKGGVDILELGLPFSDPIADGPTIQAASIHSLNAGTTPKRVLEIAKTIRSKHDIPVVIMTYYNSVFKFGLDNFLASAKEHKVDGFIVPDLPVEESADYKKAAKTQGLDTIFLAAPSTSNERLSKIIDASSGFLYLVSRYGVTGAKTNVEDSTVQLIKRLQPFTANKVPFAVGFGISKPEHVQRVISAGADAAIVGSVFIDIIQNNAQNQKAMLRELQYTAEALKSGTKVQICFSDIGKVLKCP
jgi:tryptophan synthase alpha chain